MGLTISEPMEWFLPTVYIITLLGVPWVLALAKRDKLYHIVAALYIALALFLLISLVSFSADARPYQNWGGVVGHYSAEALVSSVGGPVGLGLIILALASGALHYAQRLSVSNLLRAFALLAALLALSIMFPGMGGAFQMGASHWLVGLVGWGRFIILGVVMILLLSPFWWLVEPLRDRLQALFVRHKSPEVVPETPPLREDRVESEVEVVAEPPEQEPQEPEEPQDALEPEPPEPEEEGGREEDEILGSRWQEDEVKPVVDPSSYSRVELSAESLLDLFNVPPDVHDADDSEAERIARLIEEKLGEFGVQGKVVGYRKGPVVTRYEYEPAPGVKLSKVVGLADDLALRIKALSVRVVAPLPGKGLIGIEVPNPRRRVVYFRSLAEHEEFLRSKRPLTFALGVDPGGEPRFESLARMPHLLIAGTTGSGKSVCINTLLSCFLMSYSHTQLRLILVDPKRVELSFYEGVPHLLLPVIKERKQAAEALKKAVVWMEIRYRHFAREGTRDIENHNRTARERGDDPIPYIVIVIDEFADLMLTMGKEVEEPLARLAQMARAVGIHLVVATQRPSVDVITGIIKANFPVRIAFKVPSRVDSRTILDEMGAERLLGKGDMLFVPPGTAEPVRLHGPYVSEEETQRLASALTADYLFYRLKKRFGSGEGVREWTDWIVAEGLISCLTRDDEPGSEDRLMAVAEHGARLLGTEAEPLADALVDMREEYYIPIEEMEEAPVEEVSGEEVELVGDLDPLIPEAARLIVARGQGSATMLQRKLKVGFARAARIMDQLEELGVVEPAEGTKSRKPLVGPEELEHKLGGLGL